MTSGVIVSAEPNTLMSLRHEGFSFPFFAHVRIMQPGCIMKKIQWAALCVLAALACYAGSAGHKGGGMSIVVSSPAFGSFQVIPPGYTCDGDNASPPLTWTGVPGGAKSIALICDDPDAPAGTWVHWVCYDIPASVTSLAESIPPAHTLPCGGRQGTNDFHKIGYGGPCPPGGTHRYFFKILALDAMLDLPSGRTKRDVERAAKGHVLATGELIGTYSRKR